MSPSPAGSVWGLGGTCVNVGCIPKKLMHQAALHGENIEDSQSYGWQAADEKSGVPENHGNEMETTDSSHKRRHSWTVLRDAIKDYVGSLNWGYRVQLKENNVEYLNAFGTFIDSHTIKAITFDRKTQLTKSSVSDVFILDYYTFSK